jgi:hypothetical protein
MGLGALTTLPLDDLDNEATDVVTRAPLAKTKVFVNAITGEDRLPHLGYTASITEPEPTDHRGVRMIAEDGPSFGSAHREGGQNFYRPTRRRPAPCIP